MLAKGNLAKRGFALRESGAAQVPAGSIRRLASSVGAGLARPRSPGFVRPSYGTATLKLPPTTAMAATMAVGVSLLVGAPGGGWWSDLAGPAWPALAPRVRLVVRAPAGLGLLVAHPGLGTLLGVCAMLGALTGMTSSAALYLLSERLAATRRGHRAGLCRGDGGVRRHDAGRRDLAHRRHRQPRRAGLVCERHRRRERRRAVVVAAGAAREGQHRLSRAVGSNGERRQRRRSRRWGFKRGPSSQARWPRAP